MGLGAKKINEVVTKSLRQLTEQYQIVHICGKNNLNEQVAHMVGYKQFEYIYDELAHILAATDVVITRGGSNAIFEFLALEIPMLIIPLPLKQSRGDQILNAKSFGKRGFSLTLTEENLNEKTLIDCLQKIRHHEKNMKRAMKQYANRDALSVIIKEINNI